MGRDYVSLRAEIVTFASEAKSFDNTLSCKPSRTGHLTGGLFRSSTATSFNFCVLDAIHSLSGVVLEGLTDSSQVICVACGLWRSAQIDNLTSRLSRTCASCTRRLFTINWHNRNESLTDDIARREEGQQLYGRSLGIEGWGRALSAEGPLADSWMR